MSSINLQPTADQLKRAAEQKQIALNKLKMKQMNRDQQRSVPLPEDQKKFLQEKQLTSDMKAEIEKKRQAALELRKSKTNSPPGKAIAPSRNAILDSRPNPYQSKPLIPRNPETINKDTFPVPSTSKPQLQKQLKNNISVTCQFEFISEERFVVKTDTYNETVINEFKAIKSKIYGE